VSRLDLCCEGLIAACHIYMAAEHLPKSKSLQEGRTGNPTGATSMAEFQFVKSLVAFLCAASQAVDQHDMVLRQFLGDFCGYEVTTEVGAGVHLSLTKMEGSFLLVVAMLYVVTADVGCSNAMHRFCCCPET